MTTRPCQSFNKGGRSPFESTMGLKGKSTGKPNFFLGGPLKKGPRVKENPPKRSSTVRCSLWFPFKLLSTNLKRVPTLKTLAQLEVPPPKTSRCSVGHQEAQGKVEFGVIPSFPDSLVKFREPSDGTQQGTGQGVNQNQLLKGCSWS